MGLRINIDPDLYRQRIPARMNGVDYIFSFFYVRRVGGWHFHLDKADGTRVISGVRLITGLPLLQPYINREDIPPGILQLLGSDVVPRDPERDEIGDTFELFYWEDL